MFLVGFPEMPMMAPGPLAHLALTAGGGQSQSSTGEAQTIFARTPCQGPACPSQLHSPKGHAMTTTLSLGHVPHKTCSALGRNSSSPWERPLTRDKAPPDGSPWLACTLCPDPGAGDGSWARHQQMEKDPYQERGPTPSCPCWRHRGDIGDSREVMADWKYLPSSRRRGSRF